MPEPLFCPECRGEFLATATQCSECGVSLVPASELERHASGAMPPVEELVCVRASSVGWAQALSERLAEAGISHRIEVTHDDSEDGSVRRPGANLPFGVYVRPEDSEAAEAVDAEFMRSQLPDLETGEEPSDDPDACPACGARAEAGAEECPDCGLALL
jgi:hypothetical protein